MFLKYTQVIMPSLRYTSVEGYERYIGSETFSRLIFEDRKFVQFSDVPDTPFDVDGWRKAAYALLEAEQDVEDLLSARYVVPFDDLPVHVEGRVFDLAVAKLYDRHGKMPQAVKQSKDSAEEWLLRVAEGDVDLNLTESEGEQNINTISAGTRSNSIMSDLP